MGQRLADAITSMESRQNLMNERMAEFVEQLRSLVRDSQTETNHKLQTTLGDRRGSSPTNLGAQGAGRPSLGVERMTAQADETVAKLAALTESLMAEVRIIASEVRGTVDAMRNVTSDAVTRMNSGAETMFLAANEFTKAGEGVAGVLQQAVGITNKLAEAAGSVSVSSTMLQGVVADYATTRETLAAMLADLRSTVENAKREANLTADILVRIESASQKLGQAQKDAEGYLAGISEVIAGAHSEFAAGLTNILGEGYREFYDRLSNATGLLRQAIEELASTVEPARV
jgi:hypothetical protein